MVWFAWPHTGRAAHGSHLRHRSHTLDFRSHPDMVYFGAHHRGDALHRERLLHIHAHRPEQLCRGGYGGQCQGSRTAARTHPLQRHHRCLCRPHRHALHGRLHPRDRHDEARPRQTLRLLAALTQLRRPKSEAHLPRGRPCGGAVWRAPHKRFLPGRRPWRATGSRW